MHISSFVLSSINHLTMFSSPFVSIPAITWVTIAPHTVSFLLKHPVALTSWMWNERVTFFFFHPCCTNFRGTSGRPCSAATTTWVWWRWGRLRGLSPCPCPATTPRSATSTEWTRVTQSTSAAGTCRQTWGRTSTWWSRRRGLPRSCRVQYVADSSV